ncbi:hypothetical protein DQF64_02795 [Moraxella bovis]|nr:hypothetical protein DQF64_02795 [Moraxella bovis]
MMVQYDPNITLGEFLNSLEESVHLAEQEEGLGRPMVELIGDYKEYELIITMTKYPKDFKP